MADLPLKKTQKRSRTIRWVVLLAVLITSTVIGLLHQKAPELRMVSVDALCPFGGIETAWRLISNGTFVRRIAMSSVILLAGTVIGAVIFGRAFCGQICPLGTLQDLFSKLRTKLGVRRSEVPGWLDTPARFLKYAVLGIFTWLAWLTASLVIRPYDPWVAYHHLTSAELFTGFGIGFAVLGVSLAGSFAYDRFFCKYACPMGAFLALLSKLSIYKVRRTEDACISCMACDKACPMNLAVATGGTADPFECISCGECVNVCPKPDALNFQTKSGSTAKPLAVTGATFGIITVLIVAGTLSGDFAFTRPSLQGQVQTERVQEQGAPLDAELIRGYMTLDEVAAASGIPVEEMRAELGISAEDSAKPMKDVIHSYGIDVQAVREYVAARLGTTAPAPEH